MTGTDKIVKGVETALTKTPYGRIKIDLKQHQKVECTNLIVEKRTRFPAQTPKTLIMDAIRVVIDTVPYGRIIIELRGEHNPIDLVVETHTQYT